MRRAFLTFFSILLLFTGTCWLIVGWFVVDDLGGWSRLALLWAVCVSPASVLAYNIATHGYPSSFVRCTLYRLFWYSQFLVVMLVIPTLLGFLIGLPFGHGYDVGRSVVLAGSAVLVVLGLIGYAGSRGLVVRHLDVQLPQLPAALDGLRIAQLSDTHVGPHTSPSHLRKAAQFTRDAKPDLIAFTGDQVDDYPRDMEVFQQYFGDLRAPLGVHAITGNHDVYAGWHEVRPRLERMGVNVLVNSATRITHNGADFWLGGTGDPAGYQMARFAQNGASPAPDIDATLSAVPTGAFHIVLAHNPALFGPLAQRGVPLTLSGHTHYGQLAIPALNWCLASPFLRFAMGAHVVDRSALYINPGTNYWGIPFRIGTPPEVTVLTLRRGSGAPLIKNGRG
ncbi:MAG TPA: metallophosphoesterase [Gemmatimonadaceae bacterium]